MNRFTRHWQRTGCLFVWLYAMSTALAIPAAAAEKIIPQPFLWTLTGTVVGPDGTSLPGVTVVLKGSTNGTATGPDGSFSLGVPETPGSLVVSFIGFLNQEIPFTGPGTFNVTLAEDVQALQEVVVVGYGTQRKEDLTGAVTAISSKDFNPGQITTPEQLITGKVAGVQITSGGGAPGVGNRIRIRGGASLNASNDPLVVIDGVPVDNSELKGASNALSMLNPNDIETFNILKDASAAAIYGSRASNGVILITTKKGRAGDKLRVDFGTLLSLSTINKTIDVLSADELRRVVNERGSPAQQALLGTANTNWQDEIFQSAFSHDNNLSLSGSYKTLPYRLSLGYLDQNGIVRTSNFKRTSAALTLNPSFLKDHLKVNLNVKGALTDNRFAEAGAIGAAVAFDPTQPVYANNNYGGYFEWTDANGNLVTQAPRNPLSTLEQRQDESQVKRSIGNLQLDYKFHFLPELRANLNLGYDISDSEGSTFQPATLATVFSQGGSRLDYSQNRTNKLLDFYFNYVKDFTGISSRVDVTAGYSYQDFIRDSPAYATLSAEGAVVTPAAPYPSKTQNTLIGFFGRLNYSFKDRYLLTANIRQDGSSRFGPGNKWGTFPSLALAWKINEEAFLKPVAFLSELKLRVGYGVTGQQEIPGGDYPYLARYTFSDQEAQYQFGNQYYLTLRPEGYDADIKWEETTTYNAGIDYGFLNGRISGSLEYYFKKTKDLLAVIPVPAGSNLINQLITNVGNIENQGLEGAINVGILNTERLTWNVGLNATYNTSKITNLSRVQNQNAEGIQVGGISGGVGNNIQIHTVGYRPYSFYVYKQQYDAGGNPLEGQFQDVNNDGTVNERDRYRYKNPEPRVYLGFNSSLAYDKWSLNLVMRGNLGNYVYNNVSSGNGVYRNITYPNYLTNLTRSVFQTNFENNQFFSDYYVENASFLRMETINLGYNFGRILNDKVDLRLSANVQNAFVITKYTGLDPEVISIGTPASSGNGGTPGTAGIDNNFYPRPRIFSFGVNVGF